MAQSFSACRIAGDKNVLFPDEIIIDDGFLTYRKGRIIGYKSVKIRLDSIASVSVNAHLLFADIVIETNGGQTFEATGFSRSDADEIVRLSKPKPARRRFW